MQDREAWLRSIGWRAPDRPMWLVMRVRTEGGRIVGALDTPRPFAVRQEAEDHAGRRATEEVDSLFAVLAYDETGFLGLEVVGDGTAEVRV